MIEAFVGVGLFGLLVAVVTLKALLPPRNTIVFSKNAEPERFLVVFVNTTTGSLGNATISPTSSWAVTGVSDLRLLPRSSLNRFRPSIWTKCCRRPSSKLGDGDCLRVGITAGLGFPIFRLSCSTRWITFRVIPSRAKFIQFFEPRWNPDFKSPEFARMFHDDPENPVSLASFVSEARGSSKARAIVSFIGHGLEWQPLAGPQS